MTTPDEIQHALRPGGRVSGAVFAQAVEEGYLEADGSLVDLEAGLEEALGFDPVDPVTVADLVAMAEELGLVVTGDMVDGFPGLDHGEV